MPVLAPVQLNRDPANGGPRLSDIREAGGIEQDADALVLLNLAIGQPDNAVTVRVVDLAKHRGGPTGKAELLFRRAASRFENSPP